MDLFCANPLTHIHEPYVFGHVQSSLSDSDPQAAYNLAGDTEEQHNKSGNNPAAGHTRNAV